MKTLRVLMEEEYFPHLRALHCSERTVESYRAVLKGILRWLADAHGVFAADQLRGEHLERWLRHLQAYRTRKGLALKPGCINNRIAILRSFFNYLAALGLMAHALPDQLLYVKQPHLLPTSVLNHAQVKKLLRRVPLSHPLGYRDRTLFELLYSTGIRATELERLNISDIDLPNRSALVDGKGGKQRMVPIGRTALRYLETYLKAVRPFLVRDPKETALFVNSLGGRLTYPRILRLVHVYADPLGFEVTVTPHTFRRSCTTELIRGGANMYHVKEMLGHENLATLRHYAKLNIADLKKTHEKCHPREREFQE